MNVVVLFPIFLLLGIMTGALVAMRYPLQATAFIESAYDLLERFVQILSRFFRAK